MQGQPSSVSVGHQITNTGAALQWPPPAQRQRPSGGMAGTGSPPLPPWAPWGHRRYRSTGHHAAVASWTGIQDGASLAFANEMGSRPYRSKLLPDCLQLDVASTGPGQGDSGPFSWGSQLCPPTPWSAGVAGGAWSFCPPAQSIQGSSAYQRRDNCGDR